MRISDWSSDVCSSDLLFGIDDHIRKGTAAFGVAHRAVETVDGRRDAPNDGQCGNAAGAVDQPLDDRRLVFLVASAAAETAVGFVEHAIERQRLIFDRVLYCVPTRMRSPVAPKLWELVVYGILATEQNGCGARAFVPRLVGRGGTLPALVLLRWRLVDLPASLRVPPPGPRWASSVTI